MRYTNLLPDSELIERESAPIYEYTSDDWFNFYEDSAQFETQLIDSSATRLSTINAVILAVITAALLNRF
jgi:hypothetical protein